MKLRSVLVVVCVAGLGIAMGSYLTPKLLRLAPVGFWRTSPAPESAVVPNTPLPLAAKHPPEVNSSELTAMIQESPDSFGQTKKLLAYVGSLAAEEIPGAIVQMEKSSGEGRDEGLSLLIGRWAVIDPKAAQNGIANIQDLKVKSILIRAVYDALAKQDSAAAIDQARQLTDKQERDEAMAGIIRQIVQNDPAQALTLYQEAKSDSPDAGTQLRSIFRQWTQKDPDQATQAALQLSASSQRETATLGILNQLFEQDRQSAATWVDQLPRGQMQMSLRLSFVNILAFNDPPAAAQYVISLPIQSNGNNDDLLRFAISQWGWSDPAAAMKWVESLPLKSRNSVRSEYVRSWADIDPQGAANYVTNLPISDEEKNDLFSGLTRTWIQDDPQSALAWINQIPDEKQKIAILSGATSNWAFRDFEGASAYVESMPDGAARQQAMVGVSESRARDDPAAALQWVAKFPEGAQKEAANENIARIWAYAAPDQAAAWVSQLPSGSTHDAMANSCSKALEIVNPAQAYQFAGLISDPNQRQSQLTEVFKHWIRYDPDPATTAIQSSSLPDDMKQQLLQMNR